MLQDPLTSRGSFPNLSRSEEAQEAFVKDPGVSSRGFGDSQRPWRKHAGIGAQFLKGLRNRGPTLSGSLKFKITHMLTVSHPMQDLFSAESLIHS